MRGFRYFIVLLAVALVWPAVQAPSARAAEVRIEDPVVEQAIRQQLGEFERPLSDINMKEFSSLELTDGRVRSLKGLESAYYLDILTSENNPIEDLSPLAGLKYLNLVTITGSAVSDLRPLSSAQGLVQLIASDNRIVDVSPLAGLSKLENLNLSGNRIADLSPLVGLPGIKRIVLTDNPLDPDAPGNREALAALRQRGVFVEVSGEKPASEPADPDEPIRKSGIRLEWEYLFDVSKGKDYVTNRYVQGNGVYLSVDRYSAGDYVSKDGIRWVSREREAIPYFRSVAWGKGQFVGIDYGRGEGVAVWTSKDGMEWTPNEKRIGQGSGSVEGVAFDGKRFVAVGGRSGSGVIATSEDGLTWTERRSGLPGAWGGIAWGNGVFVAIGGKPIVAVSRDGIEWRKANVPAKQQLDSIRYVGGKFVIAADEALYVSSDGAKWTTVSMKGLLPRSVDWVKDRFFVSGYRLSDTNQRQYTTFLTSKDGIVWANLEIAGSGLDTSAIFYEKGLYRGYSDVGVYESKDGRKWKQTKKIPLRPYRLANAAVGGGMLVAVGGSYPTLMEKDLDLHTRDTLRIDAKGAVRYGVEEGKYPLEDVIWTGKQFFAVGYEGTMALSKDGLAWTPIASPTKEWLTGVIRVKDRFYVVGSGGLILSSKDLKNWTKHKTKTKGDLNAISWNGKTFMAVGARGLVLVSDDGGNTWNQIGRNFPFAYSGVAWGNETFAVTSPNLPVNTDSVSFYRTADGRKWQEEIEWDSGIKARAGHTGIHNLRFTGGLFAATAGEGTVFLSKDAKSWARQDIPYKGSINSVQYFNGKLYAISGEMMMADWTEQ